MARLFEIDLRALVTLELPDPSSCRAALSNKEIAGYLWETLSYFGCTERVDAIIKRTADEEGFNALTFDAFIRRIERALDEAGFEVAKRAVPWRAMYADAQAGRFTDMTINVFGANGANGTVVVCRAHKCVLSSASPFLKAMIEHRSHPSMHNIGAASIDEAYEIRDIPAHVFAICMEFMYTGQVRRDVPMEPDLLAGVVIAAGHLIISDGLLSLIGRELITETNALCALQAACITHATDGTRRLVEKCAVHIVRTMDQGCFPLAPALPMAALYAIAGEVVNEQPDDKEAREKRMMHVGTAVLALTGREKYELHAHLIANGTPPNMHAGNYRVTFANIDTTNAPVYKGRRKHTARCADEHTFFFCIGQCEYAACVETSAESVRITVVALRTVDAKSEQAPQLVTIRTAESSMQAVLAYGCIGARSLILKVRPADLDQSGIISVEIEADPLFAISSELIGLAVQQGDTIEFGWGLDARVLEWILKTKCQRASYAAILHDLTFREDYIRLTDALISGFGVGGVSTSEMTGLLSQVPSLFDPNRKGMLDMLVKHAIGCSAKEPDRAPLMGLIDCISQGIRTECSSARRSPSPNRRCNGQIRPNERSVTRPNKFRRRSPTPDS
jgi:hypothetical protein